jgi:outer membrane protein insertion porin family
MSKTLVRYSLIGFLMFNSYVFSQENSYVKGKEYILDEISVSGLKTFNEQTVITYSGLRKGQEIRIPRRK